MTSHRMTPFILALALAVGTGGATMAHDGQHAQAMGPGMMSGQGMGQGMGPGMMDSHVEGRIAFLKAELEITPAQEKLWVVYADALRASAKDMAGMQGTVTTMVTATAFPERLDAVEAMMSDRLDELKKIKAAALPLYAALSAEQKTTADQLMPAMGMGMGMGMGGGMGTGDGMGQGMMGPGMMGRGMGWHGSGH